MEMYLILAPEILLLVGALISLFVPSGRVAAVVGALVTGAGAVAMFFVPQAAELFGGMLRLGTPELTMRFATLVLSFLFFLWVSARGWGGKRAREAVTMALFALLGALLLMSAENLVVIYIAIELATIPAYVLVGYAYDREGSLEGALKYLLLSMLTGLIMAYGFSLLYGATGSVDYASMDFVGSGRLVLMAGVFVLVGFFAKITAVPFHFWAPDAYEGADTTSTTFIATLAKIGPMAALVKFVAVAIPGMSGLAMVVMVAAVASMIIGNYVAMSQNDVRRMMAYSGIATTGYILLGVGSGSEAGEAGAVFFIIIYSIAAMGQLLVVAQEGATLADISGLYRRRPYAAWASVAFIFSIIGIPPLVGFFGKLVMFSAALEAGFGWAVIVAILMSVISGGYAFKVLRAMFTPGEGAPAASEAPLLEDVAVEPQAPAIAAAVIMILAAASIVMSVFTEPLAALLGAIL